MNQKKDCKKKYKTNQCITGDKQNNYFKELYHHSVVKYRVNGVLMRSSRFQKIFNIQKTDGMYFEDNDVIW